jgi:hypothetical protein
VRSTEHKAHCYAVVSVKMIHEEIRNDFDGKVEKTLDMDRLTDCENVKGTTAS